MTSWQEHSQGSEAWAPQTRPSELSSQPEPSGTTAFASFQIGGSAVYRLTSSPEQAQAPGVSCCHSDLEVTVPEAV